MFRRTIILVVSSHGDGLTMNVISMFFRSLVELDLYSSVDRTSVSFQEEESKSRRFRDVVL